MIHLLVYVKELIAQVTCQAKKQKSRWFWLVTYEYLLLFSVSSVWKLNLFEFKGPRFNQERKKEQIFID